MKTEKINEKYVKKSDESTVAAIATPSGEGAIGVVRITGDDAISVADRVFFGEKKLRELEGYCAEYGKIKTVGTEKNETVDDVVALVYCAPHSYTGEDMVEFFCHGNDRILARVLNSVVSAGAEIAGPGEFTKRAFLNGKMSLSQAEAVMELISAKGKSSIETARDRLEGRLGKETDEIYSMIAGVCAHFAAWTDYPEEDVEEMTKQSLMDELLKIKKRLEKLVSGYETGKLISNGVKCTLAGKPNVGKSTIMNALAGEDCSIVSETAGTTRDVVEAEVSVDGVIMKLYDTAGIRESDNEIEKMGVERARKKLDSADVVLAVFDGSKPLDNRDLKIAELLKGKNVVVAVNKKDIAKNNADIAKTLGFKRVVSVSALNGDGMDELKKALLSAVGLVLRDEHEPVVSNERQYSCISRADACIKEAIDALRAGVTFDAVEVCAQSAAEALAQFSGNNVSEDVINEVFSKFCVGK